MKVKRNPPWPRERERIAREKLRHLPPLTPPRKEEEEGQEVLRERLPRKPHSPAKLAWYASTRAERTARLIAHGLPPSALHSIHAFHTHMHLTPPTMVRTLLSPLRGLYTQLAQRLHVSPVTVRQWACGLRGLSLIWYDRIREVLEVGDIRPLATGGGGRKKLLMSERTANAVAQARRERRWYAAHTWGPPGKKKAARVSPDGPRSDLDA